MFASVAELSRDILIGATEEAIAFDGIDIRIVSHNPFKFLHACDACLTDSSNWPPSLKPGQRSG